MRNVLLVTAAALALTLGGATFASAAVEAPDAIIGAPIFQSGFSSQGSCYVSNDCDECPTVSCSSASGNCHSGYNYVECDGNRTYCQSNCGGCTASVTCPDGSTVSCSGTGSSCYEYPGCWVQCDGQTTVCPGVNGDGSPPDQICPVPY